MDQANRQEIDLSQIGLRALFAVIDSPLDERIRPRADKLHRKLHKLYQWFKKNRKSGKAILPEYYPPLYYYAISHSKRKRT